MRRRSLLRSLSFLAGLSLSTTPTHAQQGDPLTLVTDWFAQAEHGGFYYAQLAGLYEQAGLDVRIRMGGPNVNATQLLIAGTADLILSASAQTIRAVAAGIPVVTIAAIFQKTPLILMAHPHVERLEDLRDPPVFLSQAGRLGFFPYLQRRLGWREEQIRPYNFQLGPFLADPNAVQQGILTSEPFSVRQQAGFEPRVFLLADLGYNPYVSTIVTRRETLERKPEVLRRFLQATAAGWQTFLRDPEPTFARIQQENPEMSLELLRYGVEMLRKYELVTGGDAQRLGIGAMTAARWQDFFRRMSAVGIFDPKTDVEQAYTLAFFPQ